MVSILLALSLVIILSGALIAIAADVENKDQGERSSVSILESERW